jgi:uncharacterized membrane protein
MLVTVISLAAGVVLLLLGLGKIVHVEQTVSTVSIGVSFGLLLFTLSNWAFGRRRRRKRTAVERNVPVEKTGG